MSDERWLATDEERAAQGLGPWTKVDDPAHVLLTDDYTSTKDPRAYSSTCYICNDPEFAQMGLPLCRLCIDPECGGHVAADDSECDKCHEDQYELWRRFNPEEAGEKDRLAAEAAAERERNPIRCGSCNKTAAEANSYLSRTNDGPWLCFNCKHVPT